MTVPHDIRRALPPRSPTGMAYSSCVRFLSELERMQR